MPKLQSYVCNSCQKKYDYLHMGSDDPATCPTCESASTAADLQLGGTTFHRIVPMYPGAKKIKAGFVHQYGDRPAEKISSQVPRGPKK